MISKFIVIEGIDGAGKTSTIQSVAETLREHNIKDMVFTHEPGGTPLADALRTLITLGAKGNKTNNIAELLMFYAARIQLVDLVIKPALARGAWVIGDRHDLSSQAYQGGGRGICPNILKKLRDAVLGDFRPDLTLYLDLPPEQGLTRILTRGKLDDIEKEPISFFQRTRARYQLLAKMDSSIITIDASRSLDIVRDNIRFCIKQWLANQGLFR